MRSWRPCPWAHSQLQEASPFPTPLLESCRCDLSLVHAISLPMYLYRQVLVLHKGRLVSRRSYGCQKGTLSRAA